MLTPRSLLGAAVAAGKIYAVGGSEGHERAVEVYDPSTDRRERKKESPRPKRGAVAAVSDKIYVIGGSGSDRWTTSAQAERYDDPREDSWTQVALDDFLVIAPARGVVSRDPGDPGATCSIVRARAFARPPVALFRREPLDCPVQCQAAYPGPPRCLPHTFPHLDKIPSQHQTIPVQRFRWAAMVPRNLRQVAPCRIAMAKRPRSGVANQRAGRGHDPWR